MITSGKGGVGKTTVTANLGVALSELGARVALIDVDFGLNNLDVVMGLENRIVYDFLDVFEGRCRAKQALVMVSGRRNLFVLPSGNVSAATRITGQQIKLVIESIAPLFDYVLIDCPAGIDAGFHRAVSCADEAIVVATPSLPSLRDADKVLTVLESYKPDKTGVVINRARGDLIMSDKMMTPADIRALLKTELLGVCPKRTRLCFRAGNCLKKAILTRLIKCLRRRCIKILKRYSTLRQSTADFSEV